MAAHTLVDLHHQSPSLRSGFLAHQRAHQQTLYPARSAYRDDRRPVHPATRRVRDSVEKPAHHVGSSSQSPSSDFSAVHHQPETVFASVSCYVNGDAPSGADQQNGYNCRRRSMTAGYQPHRTSAALEWNRTPSASSAYSGHHCIQSETTGAGQLLVVRRKLSEDSTSYRVVQEQHQQHQRSSGSAATVCSSSTRPAHGMSKTRDHDDCIAQPPIAAVAATRRAVDHWSPVDVPRRRVSTMTSSIGCGPAKLSRAVSEYSLLGSRYGDRSVNEDDQMFYGDVSWRTVADGDSPPRIAPVSGQLSKAASQTIIRPVPFKLVQVESHQGAPPYVRRSAGLPPDVATSTPANSRLSSDEGYASSSRSYYVGIGSSGHGNRSSSSDDASNSLSGVGTDSRTIIDVAAGHDRDSSPDHDDSDRRRRFSQSQEGGPLRRQSSSECNGSLPGGVVDADKNVEPGQRRGLSTGSLGSAAVAIKELEAALRGKETELKRLRDTMEQNETAIVEVLQERRRSWQAQMTSMSAEWERKLRCEQQKSFRTEQALLLQVFRLQQDNRELTQQQQVIGRVRAAPGVEVSDDRPQRREYSEQNGNFDELRAARSRLDEIRWELDERTGEVGSLSARVSAAESRNAELDAELKVEQQRATDAADRADEASRRSAAAERERDAAVETVERLRTELEHVKALADRERVQFDRERDQWLDEKRRVIDYQKQLQLNYVQMARKNRLLELDVQQLTADIERQSNKKSSPRSLSGTSAAERGLGVGVSSEQTSSVGCISDESLC